jgi:hypothetical protein
MKFTTIANAKTQTGLSYLGSINSSAKIVKNGKVSNQMTYILYLAPANTSGYNVCPNATNECKLGCLNTSGRVKLDVKNNILNARDKKTKLFFEHNEFFMSWLEAEILAAQNKALKAGYGFSVRLNGTSDIHWQETGIFAKFPNVHFYDYTKNPIKFNHIAENYHLTFSYTGYNWSICERLLKQGYNVAVVFNIDKKTDFPKEFNGFEVINGDLTDYRPDDKKGVIVGLRWKSIKDKTVNEQIKNSKFVAQIKNNVQVAL